MSDTDRYDIPPTVIVCQHGHYWRNYGDSLSMCPVSDDNLACTPAATYILDRLIAAGVRPPDAGLREAAQAIVAWIDDPTPHNRPTAMGSLRERIAALRDALAMTDELRRQQAADLLAKIERAERAIDDLCSGTLRWVMRVPAEPDHDPDLIISEALRAAKHALLDVPDAARTGALAGHGPETRTVRLAGTGLAQRSATLAAKEPRA